MRSLGRFPMFLSIYVVALAGLSAVYFAGVKLKPEPHSAETKTAPAPAAETKAPPAPSETAGAAKAPEKPDAAVATADVAGGDPKAGSGLFHACQACHSIDPGKNMVGPFRRRRGPQGWSGSRIQLFRSYEERRLHLDPGAAF